MKLDISDNTDIPCILGVGAASSSCTSSHSYLALNTDWDFESFSRRLSSSRGDAVEKAPKRSAAARLAAATILHTGAHSPPDACARFQTRSGAAVEATGESGERHVAAGARNDKKPVQKHTHTHTQSRQEQNDACTRFPTRSGAAIEATDERQFPTAETIPTCARVTSRKVSKKRN